MNRRSFLKAIGIGAPAVAVFSAPAIAPQKLSALDSINCKRIFLQLDKYITELADAYRFEIIDEITRHNFQANTTALVRMCVQRGIPLQEPTTTIVDENGFLKLKCDIRHQTKAGHLTYTWYVS